MKTEQDLQNFWNEEVRPRFTEAALESRVGLLDGTSVRYANLDNAATTKPFRAVEDRVIKEITTYGSVHRGAGQHSRQTTKKFDGAKDTIREFVGGGSDDYVVLTRNTTDAISLTAALLGKKHGFTLVSDIEHSSNLLPWFEHGIAGQYQTDGNGMITLDKITKAIAEDSHQFRTHLGLISVTGASNITGYKPPIYDIAELAHRNNARILVDVCQLIPHEQVDILPSSDSRHLDFITFSAHKMYAPFGIGVLVGSKQFFDDSKPTQMGGGNLLYIKPNMDVKRSFTERDYDAGTPNAMGLFALEEAINQLRQIGMRNVSNYEHSLVGLTLDGLRQTSRVIVYLNGNHGSIVPFDIDGMPPKLVAEILTKEYGIGQRAGPSCVYRLVDKLKSVTPEQAARISDEVDRDIYANIPGIVRASFGLPNNVEDARRFISAVKEIACRGFGYYRDKYVMNPQTGDWAPK